MRAYIIIKRVEEVSIGKLLFDIDVINIKKYKNKFTTNRNKYLYYRVLERNCNNCVFDSNKLWIPFIPKSKLKYIVKCNYSSINISKRRFYTNIVDNIDLYESVIIYGTELKDIFAFDIDKGKLKNYNPRLSKYFTKKYFDKLILFFIKIFNSQLNCISIIAESSYEAVSYPGIIILNPDFYNRPLTYVYKYVPHEIFHQVIGCKVKCIGYGKEWMRESFVEYLQLVFIKEVLGTEFFSNQLNEYKRIDIISNNIDKPTLYGFDFELDYNFYDALVYGRGVLLFQKIFKERMEMISAMTEKLPYLVKLEEFLDIIEDVTNIDSTYILDYYIKKNGIIEG